jgi:hypothetical protein
MMRPLAARVRRHLSYATVVSALTAFVVLCGGAAFAANQLGKKTVGAKQLKANAVTSKKIKKNAVTRAKIKNSAVDGTKVEDGSLGSVDLQIAGMPYSRVVEKLRANVDLSGTSLEPAVATLPFTYTQEAGRTDSYLGAVDVNFDPSCVDRTAVAYLLMDAPTFTKFEPEIILYAIAVGVVSEEGNAQATRRINLGAFQIGNTRIGTSSPQTHKFSIIFAGLCGSGAGARATSVSLDVIGTK